MDTALQGMMSAAAVASVLAVADAAPKLNVAPGCKAAVVISKSIDLSEAQSYDNCIHEEDKARSELEQNWASYSSVVRDGCVSETKENAYASYVEVLTCIQISQDPAARDTILQWTKKQK